MYARLTLLCVAIFGSLGAGQAYTVHGAPAAATKEAAKGNAKLFGAGAIRYWLDGSRTSGTSQSYDGMVG